MESAAGYVFPKHLPTGVDAVQFTMQTAAANGLSVVRAFGHGHDPWSVTLQEHPGADCRKSCPSKPSEGIAPPLHATIS